MPASYHAHLLAFSHRLNRQFFTRNLTDAHLVYLARESLPGYLRFGGTGNDELTYAFGDYNRTAKELNATHLAGKSSWICHFEWPVIWLRPDQPSHHLWAHFCEAAHPHIHSLAQTYRQSPGLMNLASKSGAKMLFGLNITHSRVNKSKEYPEGLWDPQNARDMISYALAQRFEFYGFELGE